MDCLVSGLGFRVWGLGFRVSGFGSQGALNVHTAAAIGRDP